MLPENITQKYAPILENIPEEIRGIPRWINWSAVWDKDKMTKPPMNYRGYNGSVTSPDTWTTLETAYAALGREAVYKNFKGDTHDVTLDGVGFVLTRDDNITGVDLDHVVTPETGEIHPAAMEAVEMLDSYTEFSPSGTGLRILVKNNTPLPWSKNTNSEIEIEVYETGRFLTVTGRHLEGTPRTLEQRDDALAAFMSKHPRASKKVNLSTEHKGNGQGRLNLNAFIEKHNIHVFEEARDNSSEVAFNIRCPWVEEHSGGDESGTRIGQYADGALWFRCEHAHCEDRRWREVREYFEPGVYDRKRSRALTDTGNAERFAEQEGKNVRWVGKWSKFLVWNGRVWSIDYRGDVSYKAQSVAQGIHAEATRPGLDPDQQKKITKHAMTSQSGRAVRAMVELAKPRIAAEHTEFDAHPWLLNCPNGIVDLKTGKLLESGRSYMLSKMAGTEYDPDATAPTFESVVSTALPDPEIRSFVQRVLGMSLIGKSMEEILVIFYGNGANSKSTIVNAVIKALGEYGVAAAPDLLMAKGNTHPTELADLFGARMVSCMESDEGRRLNEGLVKQLTGGDKITARRMREDFWSFDPTHTLFLGTNHRPEIKGTDHAIWRRLKLVPFEVTIPESQQDKYLGSKLEAELPGILAWLVQGCLEWQRVGLSEPDAVKAATQDYKADMDVLAQFIEDCCVVGENYEVPATPLYKAYTEWSELMGEKNPLTQRSFGHRLGERGFDSFKYTSGPDKDRKGWRGIGLPRGGSTPFPGPPDVDFEHNTLFSSTSEEKSGRLESEKNPSFAGKTHSERGQSGQSGPESGINSYAQPREGDYAESLSASSASSAPPLQGARDDGVVDSPTSWTTEDRIVIEYMSEDTATQAWEALSPQEKEEWRKLRNQGLSDDKAMDIVTTFSEILPRGDDEE